MILVRDSIGRYQLGCALLDSCSQLNFMTDGFSQKLHLPRTKQTTEVVGIANAHSKSRYRSSSKVLLSFCFTPHISYQPNAELDVSSWYLPPNIQLADENFFKSKIIGTEIFFDILSVGQVNLGPNLSKLYKTLFEWIVAGRHQPNSSRSSYMLSIEEVDLKLQRLWKIEEIQSALSGRTQKQNDCESFLSNALSRESSGRRRFARDTI